jgi:uncharacterized protein DUF2800
MEELDERGGLPSASDWHRYEQCAGSFQLSNEAEKLGMTAHRKSMAAERGTRIHAALAGQQVELAEEEQATSDFLRERAAEQVKRIFGDHPVKEVVETRLWLTLAGERVASGRFDRLYYDDQTALCQDFKTGWREPVPAEINAQLKFLSVVVALELPHITSVVCQIVSGQYGVTETRYSIAQLANNYDDLRSTLRRINDPQAPFNPSVEACRYCPAIAICQAVKGMIMPVARLQYSELPDGERAAKLLQEVELLERHLEAIKTHYSVKLTDPNYKVPGWTLAPGPSRREVSDWRQARALLSEFIDAGELDALSNYSIPAVEKLLAKNLQLKNKETGAKLAEILGSLLTVRPGNLILKKGAS